MAETEEIIYNPKDGIRENPKIKMEMNGNERRK